MDVIYIYIYISSSNSDTTRTRKVMPYLLEQADMRGKHASAFLRAPNYLKEMDDTEVPCGDVSVAHLDLPAQQGNIAEVPRHTHSPDSDYHEVSCACVTISARTPGEFLVPVSLPQSKLYESLLCLCHFLSPNFGRVPCACVTSSVQILR
jgi:hypothetical protein